MASQKRRPEACQGGRVATRKLEAAVVDNVRRLGRETGDGILKRAVSGFDAVWDQLFPVERRRIIEMLVDEVVYDASTRDFEIKLNAPGIQLLAQEAETRETA